MGACIYLNGPVLLCRTCHECYCCYGCYSYGVYAVGSNARIGELIGEWREELLVATDGEECG